MNEAPKKSFREQVEESRKIEESRKGWPSDSSLIKRERDAAPMFAPTPTTTSFDDMPF